MLAIIAVGAFFASYLIWLSSGVAWPVQIVACLYFFALLPYLLYRAFPMPHLTVIERGMLYIILMFFLIFPVQYLLNTVGDYNVYNDLFVNGVMCALAVVAIVVEGWKTKWRWGTANTSISLSRWLDYWPLLAGLCGYFLLHYLFYRNYHFIPEWDAYGKLGEIEEVIRTGEIGLTYRGFFTGATAFLSMFTKLSPYELFTGFYIFLQSSLIFCLYSLAKLYKIKNNWLVILILAASLAVPVINMEIDTLRPQSMIVIFLPLYIYFIFRALRDHKLIYWAAASLIAVGGLNYHEFFVFIFLLHIFWIIVGAFHFFLHRAKDWKDRTIIGLVIALLFSHLGTIFSQFTFFAFAKSMMTTIIGRMMTAKWQWWFLDSYNTDGADLDVGWKGIAGAAQYYGYYMGPVILMVLLALLVLLIFRPRHTFKDTAVQVSGLFLLVFLFFAEYLPRIGFYYLPERFWILITLAGLPLLVPLIATINTLTKPTRAAYAFIAAWVIAATVGIGGSLYVAKTKAALTSPAEHDAALWIKQNTAPSAIFFSQAANGPMVNYFAKRSLVVPVESYFMNEEFEKEKPIAKIILPDPEDINRQIAAEQEAVQQAFSVLAANRFENPTAFIGIFNASTTRIQQLKEQLQQIQAAHSVKESKPGNAAKKPTQPLYILYSYHKFNSLYSQREWWQKANFYGAALDKFDKAYPLIYNKNGVMIWEVQ